MYQIVGGNVRSSVGATKGITACRTTVAACEIFAFRRTHILHAVERSDFLEEDHEAARRWLENLDSNTIPKKLREVSFSRSSGPGGQNVNKCVHDLTDGFH